MNKIFVPLAAALALAAAGAWAKAPPDATGECKDGTYTNSPQKEGACSSHGGVKKWLAKAEKADKATKPADKAASAAASKPADATGECKDGTYTNSATKSGACAGHKGVKTWYGGKDAAPKSAAARESSAGKSVSSTTSLPPATSSSAAMDASVPARAAPSSKSASTPASERTAAAGGGAGNVWVNPDSKVYHCEKDAVYGKTKQGEYMSEAQAKASGARPSRGKECS
jgi:hypothetical protein